jgi:CHASE2 domain-containing sensor protein
MEKLLILDLDGNFVAGFKVRLEIRQGLHGQAQTKVSGKLGTNLNLLTVYRQWQQRYASLESMFRDLTHSDPYQITGGSNRSDALNACQKAADDVEQELDRWLNQDPGFIEIRERLLQAGKKFRLWVETNDVWLQRLPWEKWSVLKNASAEVGLVLPEYDTAERKHSPRDRVRILAVSGHATDLNSLEDEQQIINKLVSKAGAEIVWKQAPSPSELNALLRAGGLDILIFSGHSASTEDGKRCEIQLTAEHRLEIPDFRFALREATEKGLRLAIFNSCDGIGLAHQLAAEKGITLPHLVFMREKLPDAVSPKFLAQFFESFIGGESLYAAVQKAQQVLHDDWEKDYPCASWLPVVCPNPTEETPTWRSLSARFAKRQKWYSFGKVLAASLVVVAVVGGVRESGSLETLELSHYDFMMQHKLQEGVDEDLVIITIDKNDMKYQDDQKMKRAIVQETGKLRSLSGQALSLLIENINKHSQPSVIAMDIRRPISAAEDYPPLAKQLKETDNFIAICEGNENIAAPPELPRKQVGFSDVPIDPNSGQNSQLTLVRRFLIRIKPDKNFKCFANIASSFPLSIVNKHLKLEISEDDKGILRLNKGDNRLISTLQSSTGPYSKSDSIREAESATQTMLKFKKISNDEEIAITGIAAKYRLRDVLNDKFKLGNLKDKIVLIGVTEAGKDDFLTPFSKKPIPGVYLHAHAISQLLDKFDEKRAIKRDVIEFWPRWQEAIWIMSWSIAGGLIVWKFRRPVIFILANGVAILMLMGSCFWLFNTPIIWVPFVPTAIGMLASTGVVWLLVRKNSQPFALSR